MSANTNEYDVLQKSIVTVGVFVGGVLSTLSKLIIFIVVFFLATASFAAEINESDVKIFLNNWLAAQNKGSYPDYAAMYSKSFVGIRRSGKNTQKLDYDAWLKDRKSMFKRKMRVTANNAEIKVSGNTASVMFEQEWESGAYKDKGDKLLDLKLDDGKIKIVREEMLFSKITLGANNDQIISKSKFTSISHKDCRKTQKLIDFTMEEYVEECPAIDDWKIFKVYEREGRSWIDIAYGRHIWSTQNQVWNDTEYNFGHFPGIDSPQVEWRTTQTGEPLALIFCVTAQNPEAPNSMLSRLFVISLINKTPHFCGMTTTIEQAREIADKATSCTTMLQRKTLPK